MMEDYIKQIKSLKNPTFQKIRSIACHSISHLTPEERNVLWTKLKNGVELLDSHELLCQYLYSYGNMHEAKIRTALSKMPSELFQRHNIQVIDWGCGQGLACVCLFDFLKERHLPKNIKQIFLIEPAELTLNRAVQHLSVYVGKDCKVIPIRKFLNDVTPEDIACDADVTLHFFSNILDVESVEVKGLAELIANNMDGEHYFVCVGPMNPNNRRIDAFANWFHSPQIIWESEHSKDVHWYTAKYKLFKIERIDTKPVLVAFNPPVQFHGAYMLDGVKAACRDNSERVNALLKYLSAFEVSIPFDMGASIYDDVNPIFAVLNNIIIRGLPTKASPYVERAFESFGNTQSANSLGGIDFRVKDLDAREVFLALHVLDNRFVFDEDSYNAQILESDFEKNYILTIAPQVFAHFLQPQRSLKSITDKQEHYAQRVDFAVEYPYPTTLLNGNSCRGCVVEVDGEKYHSGDQSIRDKYRTSEIERKGWTCIRVEEQDLHKGKFDNISSEYIRTIIEAFEKEYNPDWIRTLQLVLSPIAVARVEKTIVEAVLIGKLDLTLGEWNVLVEEKDVPCAALAFADLKQIFNHLCSLSEDYCKYSFPKVNLTIVSTKEFADSPLHKSLEHDVKVTVLTKMTKTVQSKHYDMVIDIAVMRRACLESISFSKYKCRHNCYFNIRSAHRVRSPRYIYTSDVINYKPLVSKDSQGNYYAIEDREQHLRYFMQLLFRKESFRPGQLPILSRALQNKSVIGLLPTGGGKSLTYQIAAMLQPGVTLVIDPLRSLMKDQYDGLREAGIDTCTFINTNVDVAEKEERAALMEKSQMQFVFLSPERLCIYGFRERLKNMHELGVYFSYGVIDEVHCVSEWGHDFRFTYLHLGRNLYNYVLPKQTENRKHLTLFGLTATASFDVLADVERELSGNGLFPLDSESIVRDENTNRLELQYKIERVPVQYNEDRFYDPENLLSGLPKPVNIADKWAAYNSKKEFLAKYLSQIPAYMAQLQTEKSLANITRKFFIRQNKKVEKVNGLYIPMPEDYATPKSEYKQAGIVFCPHKNSTGISVNENEKCVSQQMRVGTFMGSGEEDEETSQAINRESFENLDLFRENKLPLMIATKAFGMGIDKPNVRFTVNMNYSSSLESFVQEAGRAGRDRHTALSVILLSDYRLVRISPKYRATQSPLKIIRNKWFKEEDLKLILEQYGLKIPDAYLDTFTPEKDMVRLRCEVCNKRFGFGLCDATCDKCDKGPCGIPCPMYNQCRLRLVPREAKGFQYMEDLKEILTQNGLALPKQNLEYLNADYETVMFFYDKNFKGSLIEKRTMYALLNEVTTAVFVGNDVETKETYDVQNFLKKLLDSEVGTELVAFISVKEVITNSCNADIDKADVAKAVYRMCCVGLIDDFTVDYSRDAYRVVAVRKSDGSYYKELQHYLERYFSRAKAEEEIQKVPNYKGENEIQKCLGYLTEFIYEKIAVKRKRAIDDIRAFCMLGVRNEDWQQLNEELKDYIYYYFNSKYARKDFEYPNMKGDNLYSLTTETDNGKESDFSLVLKYMGVVDDLVTSQDSSSQIDNVKHLQGAVRLIRRSLTDSNPTIDFLNTYCLLFLGVGKNESLLSGLKESYINGYLGFYNDYKDTFYDIISAFKKNMLSRKIARTWLMRLDEWDIEAELNIHTIWVNNFKQQYLRK